MAKKELFVEVRASAETVFGLLMDDLTRRPEPPLVATAWQPLDEGPVRVGYTLENKRQHDDHICRSRLRVTAFEPNELVEHTVVSECAVAGRSRTMVRRFTLQRKGINTKVTGQVRATIGPVRALIHFFVPSAWDADLPRSLGWIKFESERREREEAPALTATPPPPPPEA